MPKLNPVIRRATISDLEHLVGLLQELFSIEKDFEFDAIKQTKGLLCLLQNESTCDVLVAEYQKQAIGMCTMQTVVSTAEGGPAGLIEDMVVARAFRGKGVGKMLLSEMQTIAQRKGLFRLQLLADRHNRPAIDFYQKMGWSPTRMFCLRKVL